MRIEEAKKLNFRASRSWSKRFGGGPTWANKVHSSVDERATHASRLPYQRGRCFTCTHQHHGLSIRLACATTVSTVSSNNSRWHLFIFFDPSLFPRDDIFLRFGQRDIFLSFFRLSETALRQVFLIYFLNLKKKKKKITRIAYNIEATKYLQLGLTSYLRSIVITVERKKYGRKIPKIMRL